MTLKEQALHLARMGYRVFPLQENSKDPWPGVSWPDMASSDAKRITSYWTTTPQANIGIATGQGHVVLDLDIKGGVSLDAIEAVLSDHGVYIDDHMTVTTPSGGFHIYLKSNEIILNSAGTIAPGIDVRGDGGYVVGPQSSLNGKAYAIETHESDVSDLAKLPKSLIKLSRARTEQPAIGDTEQTELDKDINRQRARNAVSIYLNTTEGNRDEHLFKAACVLFECGLSYNVAFEELSTLNESFEPPERDSVLHTKLKSAQRNSTNRKLNGEIVHDKALSDAFMAVGAQHQDTKQDKVSHDDKSTFPAIVDFAEMAELPPIEWVIEDFIEDFSTTLFIGDTGSYKSYIALDIAMHLVRGAPWHGKAISKARPVLYMAGEGQRGVHGRGKAWEYAHGDLGSASEPLKVMLGCATLKDESHQTALGNFLVKYPNCVVIIDTLSKASRGWKENDADDMNAFVMVCDEMARMCNATTIGVHHPSKGKDEARGSGALRMGADTEIFFKRTDHHECTMTMTMQKNMDEWERPMVFKGELVDAVDNIAFRHIGSQPTETPQEAQGKALQAHRLRVLNVVLAEAETLLTNGVLLAQMIEVWAEHLDGLDIAPPAKASLRKWLERCKDDRKMIDQGKISWRPGPDPKLVAKFEV